MHAIPKPVTLPSVRGASNAAGSYPYGPPTTTTTATGSRASAGPTTSARAGASSTPGSSNSHTRAGAPPSSAASSSSSSSQQQQQQEKSLSAQRLNPNKCANPFQTNTKRCKSVFSQSYIAGSIPCRLHTSASKYHLHWDQAAASGFSPDLLVVCADGLNETDHPYVVLAPMMFHELVLRAEGCLEMFVPVVEPVTTHIRKALLDSATFDAALSGLHLFIQHTGNLVHPHLVKLVPVLAKAFHDKKRKDSVVAVLGLLEQNCGPDATKLIKSKIPTY